MSPLTPDEIAFLTSLDDSALIKVLSTRTKAEQVKILRTLATSQSGLNDYESRRDRQNAIQKSKRSESARIEIARCENPARRRAALADPELFLLTYFPDRYTLKFGPHHKRMIEEICSRAKNGGRQAIAAPRGCGKSELVKGLLVFLVLSELVRFPLPVAATTPSAKRLFQDFRRKLATSPILRADFPEVCGPIKALDGAPQRAGRQHIDGVLTNIVWTATDYVRLPDVPPEYCLDGAQFGGVKMAYFGLDAAFRGVNIDGDRPDFVLIDDPETKESAKSHMQIQDREETIDRDIAGLAGQEENLSIVILTTVQNSYCLSFRLTDRTIKPAFNGLRYGMVVKWPERMELWDEYISIRHADQSAGDRHGKKAVEFYLANRDAMDAGVEMLSDHFVEIEAEDGTRLVHSAIQQAFNKIAETSLSAFKTEYQNDPDPEEAPDTTGLTAAKVASRISGLEQGVLHPDTQHITLGLDIGKYFSHWVKVAWHGNAIGHIIDYGVMETPGMSTQTDAKAVMVALLPALHQWRTDMLADNNPDFCLIDSGDYTDAVYEFVRQVGGLPFAASKGHPGGKLNLGKESADRRQFLEAFAHHLPNERLWLYNVNSEYWKQWVHDRFATATRDENEMLNDGSLSLFSAPGDRKRHLSFSHHIVAEERRDTFVKGKGIVRKWVPVSKNNHYLDATALACAAAGCLGVRLIPKAQPTAAAITAKPRPPRPAITNPYGQPFLATERK